ncbi:membrane protein [Klebsiella variicola]|uniref:Membrane protein n=1 Tax=Klebsiella variicola TaxID=244366 RepID=A0A7H4MIS2_KLEVA|nr:membrane protein [Klebsiella variicola]
MASPDINTEDFSAAVDFLGLQKEVDRNRIGLLGICGWGGMALNDAAMDTRVKAVATSVMYDMSRAMGAWGRRWQRPLHDSRPPSGTAVLERAALEGCGKRHFRPRWA